MSKPNGLFRLWSYDPNPDYDKIKRLGGKKPQQRKVKDDPHYWRYRWARRLDRLAAGCVPIDEVVFGECPICGAETFNYRTTPRETCSRKCGWKLAQQRRDTRNAAAWIDNKTGEYLDDTTSRR
jgi:ribosomal protein L37E